MTIRDRLFALADKEYAAFQSKLTPNVPSDRFIGVRVPEVRQLAKALLKEGGYEGFLVELPHEYYDENMLHGLLLSEIKDYEVCVEAVDKFLPYVDNWAVCDIMSPKVFKKHKGELLAKIRGWIASPRTYTCRFGIEMLMSHYLDDDFDESYLDLPASVVSEEYYVKMMVAWFFATALTKRWDAAMPYIEQNRIADKWTHNKAIQKACESYRITDERKEMLKKLKR